MNVSPLNNSAPSIIEYIHDLKWSDIPDHVKHQATRCLLDTVGVFYGGTYTDLSKIIYDFAAVAYGGNQAKLWLDGRPVSLPGAALAHGMTIDALDLHDSCKEVKGHVGVAVVPVLIDSIGLLNDGSMGGDISGEEFMTSMVMSYDIATRAGMALHGTACDYHTSGAWSALACAAILSRRMGLSHEQTRHALGIAEYHGPRSQMMRCIDYPTMLKDGSGYGAMAGVSAAMMAAGGFTGAPAITVEGEDVAHYWDSLGSEWMLDLQCFKKYAVCYWAQASVDGALKIQKEHDLAVDDIERINIGTFHNAVRLAVRRPEDTEKAQYALPYPVAAALSYGRLDWNELSGETLKNEAVLQLADRINLFEEKECDDAFPAERRAKVSIETKDGRHLHAGTTFAPWQPHNPPTDDELLEKYRALANDRVGADVAQQMEDACWKMHELESAKIIQHLLNV